MTRARLAATRFGWMLLIWCLSVLGLGIAAWLMRLLMRLIGMAA